ncbi:hypothetical protein OAO87_01095 [bacterium]|nr:hypothetical protein [bacterium]
MIAGGHQQCEGGVRRVDARWVDGRGGMGARSARAAAMGRLGCAAQVCGNRARAPGSPLAGRWAARATDVYVSGRRATTRVDHLAAAAVLAKPGAASAPCIPSQRSSR